MLRFGNVVVADYDKGRYEVFFPEDTVRSFPLPHVAFSTSPGKSHAPISVGTWVACLMDDSGVEGVVLGPYYTEAKPPVQGLLEGEYSLTVGDGTTVSAADGQVTVEVSAVKVDVAADGVEIANATETLGGLIDELVSAIGLLAPISAAPGAPCTPNPVDTTKLNLIKTRLTTLLK